MSVKFGYRAVEERYQPSRLLDFAILAEKHGFDFICISDHFHPWFHKGGRAGHAWIWLGAAGAQTKKVRLGTGVTTCIYRYNPAIVAQAFATLDELFPGRIFLGIGTGEAMNEVPMAPPNVKWPRHEERLERTVEAVKIIRSLWEGDFVDFEGKYFRLMGANLYTKPKGKIPIYFAANGPKALRVSGQLGDALMTGSGDSESIRKVFSLYEEGVRESGRRPEDMPKMVEMQISYDEDFDRALDSISMWRPVRGAFGIPDPRELDRLREGIDPKVLTDKVYTSMEQLIAEVERLSKWASTRYRSGATVRMRRSS